MWRIWYLFWKWMIHRSKYNKNHYILLNLPTYILQKQFYYYTMLSKTFHSLLVSCSIFKWKHQREQIALVLPVSGNKIRTKTSRHIYCVYFIHSELYYVFTATLCRTILMQSINYADGNANLFILCPEQTSTRFAKIIPTSTVFILQNLI